MSATGYVSGKTPSLAVCFAPLSLLLSLTGAAAPEAASDPHAQGEMLSRRLLEGNVAAVEQAMTPEFLAGIGGRKGLTRMVEELKGKAGRELQVLRQVSYSEAGHVSYYRVSRFERMPSLTARWVFNGEGRVAALSVRPTPEAAVIVQTSYRPAGSFRLPFGAPSGGHWYVAWGGDDHVSNKHVVARDQRYAYDFVVTRGRAVFGGKGAKNEDHYCWNEPIYAPASGRIVGAVGDIGDNPPGTSPPTAPPAGNHVVIDHGDGAFSMIAHLRLGSLAVRPGQQVAPGTLLGRCGNSGRSDLPHVHYHVQTTAGYGEGDGLPVPFSGYFLGGTYVAQGRPVRGDYLTPAQIDDAAGPRDPARK